MPTVPEIKRLLNVNAPHYTVTDDGISVAITTRNGTHTYTHAPPSDDLTAITGIGTATAQALNNAGIFTFTQLAQLDYAALVDIVGSRTANAINKYLAEHAILPF